MKVPGYNNPYRVFTRVHKNFYRSRTDKKKVLLLLRLLFAIIQLLS